jgi:hypothetical protein
VDKKITGPSAAREFALATGILLLLAYGGRGVFCAGVLLGLLGGRGLRGKAALELIGACWPPSPSAGATSMIFR